MPARREIFFSVGINGIYDSPILIRRSLPVVVGVVGQHVRLRAHHILSMAGLKGGRERRWNIRRGAITLDARSCVGNVAGSWLGALDK